MAGDYVSPPTFSTSYSRGAVTLMIEHGAGTPETIRRITAMAEAFDYCAAEWEIWGRLVQDIDSIRSGSHWSPMNVAWLLQQAQLAGAKPAPPPPPSAVQIAALRNLLGALVDELGHGQVAVALDAAMEARKFR